MIIALSIVVLFLFLLIFLLVTPVIFRVDTFRNDYYIKIWGLVKCSLKWDKGLFLDVKVPFYRFEVDLLKERLVKPAKDVKTKHVGSKTNHYGDPARQIKRLFGVMRTWQVKELVIILDTSDVIWNAWLYPLFYLLNSPQRKMEINYEGRSELVLQMEDRAYRVLRTLLKN